MGNDKNLEVNIQGFFVVNRKEKTFKPLFKKTKLIRMVGKAFIEKVKK